MHAGAALISILSQNDASPGIMSASPSAQFQPAISPGYLGERGGALPMADSRSLQDRQLTQVQPAISPGYLGERGGASSSMADLTSSQDRQFMQCALLFNSNTPEMTDMRLTAAARNSGSSGSYMTFFDEPMFPGAIYLPLLAFKNDVTHLSCLFGHVCGSLLAFKLKILILLDFALILSFTHEPVTRD
jgi:hypothetical protein